MSWMDKIKNYIKLKEGITILNITDEPTIKFSEKYNNEKLLVPTHLGIWPTGTNGPVARGLKKHALKHNDRLRGITITVNRSGTGSETRYKLLEIGPTIKQTPLATEQATMTQFEQKTKNWTETEKQAYRDYLKQTGKTVES